MGRLDRLYRRIRGAAFFGSWQLVGVVGGFLLGSLTAALLNAALPQADRLAWGWRLPFLFGIAVGAVGFYLRWRLDETPKFTEIEEQGAVAAAPLGEALRQYTRETIGLAVLAQLLMVLLYVR
jgi:MFS transporter, MHS family, proline/betaine transporter